MLTFWRAVIHLSCLSPFLWLGWTLGFTDASSLGADPIKEIEHFLGYTAILIFCAMFLLGILLQLIGKNQYQILRRPLGLWAFTWAFTHLLSYLVLELGLDFSLFWQEMIRRPYLILGGIAFVILLMMAITSLPQLKRKLGKKWFSLHQLAYPAIICAAVHYYWSSKSLTLAPILVCLAVGLIVGWKWVGEKYLKR